MDKFCKDCKHYNNISSGIYASCQRPPTIFDLVTGEPDNPLTVKEERTGSASYYREAYDVNGKPRDFCGPEAKYFEPIEVKNV